MNVREFKAICQKNEDENYLFDKYVYRKVSIYGTMLFARLGLSANTATFISLLCTLGSLWFFLQNEPVYLVIAAVLILAYHYLDHVDGELARYYRKTKGTKGSLKGSYFDLLCHMYSVNLYFFCISIALYKELQADWIVLVGLVAFVGTSSFPRLIANKTLLNRIAGDPDAVQQQGVMDALAAMNKKAEQVHAVHSAKLFSLAKLKKVAEESVGYPGIITWIAIGCLIDAYFETHYCRMALLFLTAAVRLIHSPLLAVRFMRVLDRVH